MDSKGIYNIAFIFLLFDFLFTKEDWKNMVFTKTVSKILQWFLVVKTGVRAADKAALPLQEYIISKKNIIKKKIKNYNNIWQYYYFYCIWSNKCRFGEYKRLLSKSYQPQSFEQ